MLFSYLNKKGDATVIFDETDLFRAVESELGESFSLGLEVLLDDLKEKVEEARSYEDAVEELKSENSLLEGDIEEMEERNEKLLDENESLRHELKELRDELVSYKEGLG